MAKKTVTLNRPVIETFDHVYSGVLGPVTISVSIDYKFGRIALVDTLKFQKDNPWVPAKQWVFANREIEFMQGWQDILDAMKSAISVATLKLQNHQESTD